MYLMSTIKVTLATLHQTKLDQLKTITGLSLQDLIRRAIEEYGSTAKLSHLPKESKPKDIKAQEPTYPDDEIVKRARLLLPDDWQISKINESCYEITQPDGISGGKYIGSIGKDNPIIAILDRLENGELDIKGLTQMQKR